MNFTDVQIRQADAALKLLHEAQGIVNGHTLHQAMAAQGTGDVYMRRQLVDV